MNTGPKTLNTVPANRTQQCPERVIHHDQVGHISGMQEWFNTKKSINVINYMDKIKEKKHMIITTDAEKAFYQIQHTFMIKNIQQTSNRRKLPQHNKNHI